MTEFIRSWPDSLFYLDQASTANVRTQIQKTQLGTTLLRALSDASLVDGTGSKLNEILTGLSFGNQTQRHKWRARYDTTNNRFLIEYNTGTDAAKVWSARLRLDSNGNLTTVGALTIASELTTSAKVILGGKVDANDFYIVNAGQVRTDDLVADGPTNLNNADTKIRGTKFFDLTYAENTTTQAITVGVETDITSLTAVSLPNTTQPLTSRKFKVDFNIQIANTSAVDQLIVIRAYNGPNGTKSDTQVYISGATLDGTAAFGDFIAGSFRFTPAAANRTKLGLSIAASGGNCSLTASANAARSTMFIQEIP